MAQPRRAALVAGLGTAALCVVVGSRLFQRDFRPLDIQSPKLPGTPIFAGHWSSGGRLLHIVKPEYPRELRYLGNQIVRLRCRVREDGTVTEITHEGGPAELFPYAKQAVERWRYEPRRVHDPSTGRSNAITYFAPIELSFKGTRP